ncbi:ATP-grasp fold amidoligase family protein [Candidatus Ruminimicrobiellum ovillum]|uniref:ATP-grasp fold amidoligase family protein n=1 Tax=Candidatus Ruminimicrobiellum ovillum TaxID=1947927 RepID=UPI00355A3F0F
MKIFNFVKTPDGSRKLYFFNKKILSYKVPCKYRKLYKRRFEDNLTPEEIKYILEIQFESRMGKKLNLSDPQTFNEKLQWLKLYYRNDLLTKCADKVEARDYIKEVVGEQYLVPAFGIYNSFREIDFDKLPSQFILKVNWGCKQNSLCKDKSKFNIKKIRKKFTTWLNPKKNNYYGCFEWQYKNIKPKILCEQYLNIVNDGFLTNYRFFCFNGKFKIFSIVLLKDGKQYANFYDTDLNFLPVKQAFPNKEDYVPKIANYKKMVELAEKLAKPFPHVRVDMYETSDKKIYIGELTFTNWNGTVPIEPEEYDYKFGQYLDLPKI